MKAHVDHVAISTRNFERDLDFFQSVLGMEITLTEPEGVDHDDGASMRQVWVGGIQLQRAESADEASCRGRLSHIGIVLPDVDGTLEKVYAVEGIVQAEGKPRNWFVLPEGPVIELVAS